MIYYCLLVLVLVGVISSFIFGVKPKKNKKEEIIKPMVHKKIDTLDKIPEEYSEDSYRCDKDFHLIKMKFLMTKKICVRRLVEINKLLHEINAICKNNRD